LGSGHLGLLLVGVLGFELGLWAHAEVGVKPPILEPVDEAAPIERGPLILALLLVYGITVGFYARLKQDEQRRCDRRSLPWRADARRDSVTASAPTSVQPTGTKAVGRWHPRLSRLGAGT
jgi:hypothetical protein